MAYGRTSDNPPGASQRSRPNLLWKVIPSRGWCSGTQLVHTRFLVSAQLNSMQVKLYENEDGISIGQLHDGEQATKFGQEETQGKWDGFENTK